MLVFICAVYSTQKESEVSSYQSCASVTLDMTIQTKECVLRKEEAEGGGASLPTTPMHRGAFSRSEISALL